MKHQLWPLAISINEFDDGNYVGISVQGSPDIGIIERLIQRCSYARGNSVEAHLVYPDGLGLHKIRLIHIPPNLPNRIKVSVQNPGRCKSRTFSVMRSSHVFVLETLQPP